MRKFMVATAAALGCLASALPAAAAEQPALRIALPPAPPAPDGPAARVFSEDGSARAFARDLGKALGRTVALSRLEPEASRRALAAGTVDLAVGTGEGIALGPGRALSVAMRTDTDIHAWSDLAGRTACFTATQANAAALVARLGAIAMPQRTPAHSLVLMRTGGCDAALHEADQLSALFALPDWQKFSATLPPRDPDPLVLILAPGAESLRGQVEEALAAIAAPGSWAARNARWARNVALEVWLEQDAPDCH